MAKSKIHKILSHFVEVRAGETSSSVLLFFYFFMITSSAYIIKPVKISLFLERLSFTRLPYAYLLTAVLMGFMVSLNSKLLHVMKRQVYISLSLGFFMFNMLLFWIFFRYHWQWLSLVYWFWADIFTATSVTQFWILVNDIYNPRQAKRLVGFLVSGGLLGGVAGALLASFLAQHFGTENLLLICPLMLVLCLIIVNFVSRHIPEDRKQEIQLTEGRKKPEIGYGKSFRLIRENRHLLLLCGIMIATFVVTTMIDFQFNSVIEGHFTETVKGEVLVKKDAMTSFLGSFFSGLLIFSYLLHILLTSRILKNFGIRTALLIAPVFLLVGSVAVFFIPAIFLVYWGILIKGADKSLAHSLNQSVRELLYIPVSPEIKYKAKVFIDMFVNKFAKGLGALLILVFLFVFHFSIVQISLVTIVFLLLWIGLNLLITREYVGIVKRSLRIKWEDADKFVGEKIDIDMTKLVFDTLESKKRSSVLYAMNLFDLIKREKLSPALRRVISHKSDEIRAGSMDSLLELDGEALLPEMDDALEEEDLDAQIKEIMSLDVYQELMREHIDQIADEESKGTEVSKMEAAKVLGMMEPTSSLIHNLKRLLRDESPEVIRYAVESAGKLKKIDFVPFVIPHLRRSSTQRIASRALAEYGNKIVGTLKDYLVDPDEDVQIRKTIPDILAAIGTQKAAYFLSLGLRKGGADLESEIIEAIFKMKSKNPRIGFQDEIILPETLRMIKKSYLILIEIDGLRADEKKVSLAKELEKNLARCLKHLFELLSLIYQKEDVIKAYQNITAGTKKNIDYSIELLDNILKKEMMEFLLPLIDDIPFEDKVKKCRKNLRILERAGVS
jgi:ATP/ADP translocase/HEAT repeat protein